jgi:hypothetical protein
VQNVVKFKGILPLLISVLCTLFGGKCEDNMANSDLNRVNKYDIKWLIVWLIVRILGVLLGG